MKERERKRVDRTELRSERGATDLSAGTRLKKVMNILSEISSGDQPVNLTSRTCILLPSFCPLWFVLIVRLAFIFSRELS